MIALLSGLGGNGWLQPRADSITGTLGLASLIPHLINADAAAGLTATYAIELRGGPTIRIDVRDGTMTAAEGRDGPVDCRFIAESTAWNLSSYGRIPSWKPMLKGQLLLAGRRPWMAPRFAKLLSSA